MNYVNSLKLSWLINETFPPCIYGLKFQEMLSQNHNVICFHRLIPNECRCDTPIIIIDCNWLVFGFCWVPTDIIVMILSNQLLIARTSINYLVNWMIFNCNKRKIWQSFNIACLHLPEVHICLSKRNHECWSLSYGV